MPEQPFPNARQLSELGFPDLQGIWTGSFDLPMMQKFMSDHYLSMDSAKTQLVTISNTEYYKSIFNQIANRPICSFSFDDSLKILELGAGSGGGTLAVLDLFKNSHVISSDFSPSMLAVLKGQLEQKSLLHRCTLCQINAEHLEFVNESFDMVLGAAMLHHLFDPAEALRHIHRVLRRDGLAIFFEPFESGMKIVSLIYQMALRDHRSYLKHPRFRRYLKNTIHVWSMMTARPISSQYFEGKDDKSFFTSHEFRQLAVQIGFKKVDIFGLSQSQNPFREMIQTHLSANGFARIPKWFWEIVHDVEQTFSDNCKRDLFTEGAVVFVK